MITTVALGVGVNLDPLLGHPGLLPVRLALLGVVVAIDEIVAGVVGRIDVDALDLLTIGREQALEHLQVFSLDDHVAVGRLGVYRPAGIVLQSGGSRGESATLGVGLAEPAEFEPFTVSDPLRIDQPLQLLGVEPPVGSEQIGHQPLELVKPLAV